MYCIQDTWDKAKPKHSIYVKKRIADYVGALPGDEKYISSMLLRKFVIKYQDEIATGDVPALRHLISITSRIEKYSCNSHLMTLFRAEAKLLFDYDYFSEKKTTLWCAYALCGLAKNKICPYCNQNYAFTVTGTTKDFRPTLDHFFPKAKYPFLALSLYNLVPSCYTCNSSLKGKTDFGVIPHLHPFDMKSGFNFRISPKNNISFASLVTNKHTLKRHGKLVPDKGKSDKATENSIATFLLEHRFELNNDSFMEFAILRKELTEGRVRDIQKILGRSVDLPMLLGFNEHDYKNQMHGKIYRDLYRQFKPRT